MSIKSGASLHNFFIFNSLFGPKEGEEEKKILFFYPDSTDIDTKIRAVGLCEALLKFTDTFNPDKNCHAVHTQKTRQIYHQPEPDFWLVMTVTVPNQQKSKDGHTFIEYYSEEVQDHVLQSILKMSYRMFRLFMGTFTDILLKNQNDYENFKKRLSHFFKKYLQSLRLSHADLLDVFQGMLFLPLERHAFLKIKCFVNLVEATFSQIKYTCFLYNDQVVWSGLEQDDMQVLYKYLTTTMIPNYLEIEGPGRSNSPSRPPVGSNSSSAGNYARFMIGPSSWADSNNIQRVPKVYIYSPSMEACYLIVYRCLSATVCLLVDVNFQLSANFFKQIDLAMGPQLTSLATEIAEQYSKAALMTNSDSNARYLYMYFNHMNLAQKSTIHPDAKKTGNVSISQENMKLLADFNLDLSKLDDSGEIIGKTLSDCWVVGKLSDKREFYVILPQKNASIVEVSDELKKLNAAHFQSIFILE